jgi:hypothetical protein
MTAKQKLLRIIIYYFLKSGQNVSNCFRGKSFSEKNFYIFQAKVFCAQKTLAWKLLLKGAGKPDEINILENVTL